MTLVNIRYGRRHKKKHCLHGYRKIKILRGVYFLKCEFCGKEIKIRILEDDENAGI